MEATFEADVVRPIEQGGHSWMILDTLISVEGFDPIWLRLHMSSDLYMGVWHMLARLGGYLLTRGALRPVREMTQAAAAIADGEDLSLKSTLAGYNRGGDELHALARTLEEMLTRLQVSFEHERRFTGDAAHELRTPLNAMCTQGEYALSRETLEEKDEAIAQMLEKNEEMRVLVDHLLLMARMDAGQTPMEDSVDLAAMMEGIAMDMEPIACDRDIRIETDLQAVRLRGNRALLARAVINLVDNAIRYGREGGFVRMELVREADEAVIRVTDDGAGLTQEALEHVFERFWRGLRRSRAI